MEVELVDGRRLYPGGKLRDGIFFLDLVEMLIVNEHGDFVRRLGRGEFVGVSVLHRKTTEDGKEVVELNDEITLLRADSVLSFGWAVRHNPAYRDLKSRYVAMLHVGKADDTFPEFLFTMYYATSPKISLG